MKGFGAVVTFEINGNLEQTLKFLDGLKLCMLGPSLGGPETLVTHPALNSYYNLSREERYEARASSTNSSACPSASKIPATSSATWNRDLPTWIRYSPAEPEALWLPAPQRGLIATDKT